MPKDYNNITDFLSVELKELDEILLESTKVDEKKINLISDYIISAGGKKIRPVLSILSAKAFGYNGRAHLYTAAAIELIHTATLLHDDVVDESLLRRGKLTAHEKWGNKISILVGDFLFSQAFIQMVNTQNIGVLKRLSSASCIIARGEVNQLENINNFNLTTSEYIQTITLKTAELFAAACATGALIAGCNNNEINIFNEFGLILGICFQIHDDIIDYSLTEKEMGKKAGDDLRESKMTLPLILLRDKANYSEVEKLKQIFEKEIKSRDDFIMILELLNKYDIISCAMNELLAMKTKASKILEQAKCTNNQAKKFLFNLLDI